MTESIPELRAARDEALAAVDIHRAPGASGWYSRHRAWERAEQMLQTALWRQAVASRRWVRHYEQFVTDYGESLTWRFMVDCQAVYWVVSRGRTAPVPGWGDGAQLARRRDTFGAVMPAPFVLFTHRCWSWGYLRTHVYAPGAGALGDRCACGEVTVGGGFEEEW